MAIYHFSMKTFSRSKGQSAVAAIAYRAGAKMECEREGRVHDYTRKGAVLHSEIFTPKDAPEWAADRQALWNAVEAAEKRKNSTVAREFEVALPKELDEAQRIELVRDFAQQIVERHGCVVDASLHDDTGYKSKGNHHAHIMLTTRKLENNEFTKKTRELDQRNSGEVQYWREQWAVTANNHLRENAITKGDKPVEIDHRSLSEQGIDRPATIKLGSAAAAMERKGIKTDRGDINRLAKTYSATNHRDHKRSEKVATTQTAEMNNKIQFLANRLPEVMRDIEHKHPDLYKMLDDLGIEPAPPEKPLRTLTEPERKAFEAMREKVREVFKDSPDIMQDKLQQIDDKEIEVRQLENPVTLEPERVRAAVSDKGMDR